jgi:signal transduction histidine kinase/ActR/RegA family two-component response regulator
LTTTADGLSWNTQPRAARAYVVFVIGSGALCAAALLPMAYPQRPALFAMLFAAAAATSVWKVNLPIPLASGSTLSVSYAADLMALLLLGPREAMAIALAGAWLQCAVNVVRPYPAYRTLFSVAAEALTMTATGGIYAALGGPARPIAVAAIAEPLVGAIATYFVVNTGLVAIAIALTTSRTPLEVWRREFQWSGASFLAAGAAGAAGAVMIERGTPWLAVLMVAPVYVTYRTYRLFVGRLDTERRHIAETERLHQDAVAALAQARAAEHALVEANRVKDQFLAIVSHELRTPLNAILGWSDMLQHGRLDPDRYMRAYRAIYDGARRQAQLIEDLLDVSRITSGKLRLDCAAVDLRDIVRGAAEVVQPAADAKHIRLSVAVDPSLGSVYADGARLQQVLWNLLANAIKFTPEGGLVHATARRDGRSTEIVVTDTGQGIPPDLLTAIFEPFRQVDTTMTRSHGGLGLGLAIVKQLVEAHGGTIRAESDGAGAGATFVVRLPALIVDARARASSTEAVDAAAIVQALRGIRALVVDDDAESRAVVTAYLESEGAFVRCADSAVDAFELLERHGADLLIADIAMPDEDGYSLIQRLRAAVTPQDLHVTPAIAVTALARPEDCQRARAAGFDLHLTKPIDRDRLLEAVVSVSKLRAA